MIAAGWLVAVVFIALALQVITVAVFVKELRPLVRAVVAKNSSELALTEQAARPVTRSLRKVKDPEDDTPIVRAMGL